MTDKLASGKIRSDLYYRLNVVSVPIPPLRERIEDIPILANRFLRRFAEKHAKNVRKISSDSLQIFENYSWPGNIRELENVIERAVVMMHFEETVLLPKHLPKELILTQVEDLPLEVPTEGDLSNIMNQYERQVLENALKQHNWNQSSAAAALNISEAVMRYKIKRLQIKRPE